MDKTERILGMGYLIKSPVKNTEKSTFGRFWKLRWLVLTEVLLLDDNESVEESKLVFSYYKDKNSHKKDEQPKGTLNMSDCKSIKSYFQPQASYDHVFSIEFNDGKLVRFSAPSCEKKFKWVSLLYKYRFNNHIGTIMAAFGIPGAPSSQQLNNQNRASIRSNGRSSSQIGSYNGRDSNIFIPSDTGDCLSEEPPPLPPRRQSTLSATSFDMSSTNPNEIDLKSLQVFNDLFMLCSKCQTEGQKKSAFQRRKRNSKKWDGQQEDVELRKESFAAKPRASNDIDCISQFSNNSDDFFMEDPFDPYTKIDDILLEKVKDLKEKAEKACEDNADIKEESGDEDNDCNESKGTEDLIGKSLINEQASTDELQPAEDIYMEMNKFEHNSLSQFSSESEVSEKGPSEGDGARTTRGKLPDNQLRHNEEFKEYFEMNF